MQIFGAALAVDLHLNEEAAPWPTALNWGLAATLVSGDPARVWINGCL